MLLMSLACDVIALGSNQVEGTYTFLQIILVESILFKNKLWLGQDLFFWGGGVGVGGNNNKKINKYKTQAVINTISFFPSMLKITDTI